MDQISKDNTLSKKYLLNVLSSEYLQRIIHFGLCGYIITFPLGQFFREFFSISCFSICIAYYFIYYQKTNLAKLQYAWSIIPFIIIVFLKSFISLDPSASFHALQSLSYDSMLLFFIGLEAIKNKKDIMSISLAITFVVFYIGIDAFFQYNLGYDLLRHMPVYGNAFLTGPRNDPLLGNTVAIFLPILYSTLLLFANPLSIRKFILSICIVVPPCFFLLMSGRRTGVIAISIILLLYLILKNKKLLPIVPAFIIFSFPFLQVHRIMINTLLTNPRWEIWHTSIKLIKKNMLFGYGLNTFIQAQNVYHMPVILNGERVDCQHNIYVQLLSDTGILGLFLFLLPIILFITYAFQAYLKNKNNYFSDILLLYICSFISFLIVGIFALNLYKTWHIAPGMIVFGVMTGISILISQKHI